MKPLNRAIRSPRLEYPYRVTPPHSAGDERLGFSTPRKNEFLDRLKLPRCHREQYLGVFPICRRGGWTVSVVDLVFGDIQKLPKVFLWFNWTCAHGISDAPRRLPAVTR